jgi:mono/diheme cytochrome c family protein
MTVPRLASRAAVWLAVFVIAIGTVAVALYAGLFDVAADVPHSKPVYAVLELIRERSIIARARDIRAPDDLADARRVASGAGLYKEMCSGCHLAPGMKPTAMSQGLYPKAPSLITKHDHTTAARQFWVIKHGIKMTAMPAWGVTHSDEMIWDMVAFIRRLPSLSAEDYKAATAEESRGHDRQMPERRTRPDEPKRN